MNDLQMFYLIMAIIGLIVAIIVAVSILNKK